MVSFMKTIVINAGETNPPRESNAPVVIRPAVGSPYYIEEKTGRVVLLSPPGTRPVTSEDVYRELEDFP
jgi:hypothetical protein